MKKRFPGIPFYAKLSEEAIEKIRLVNETRGIEIKFLLEQSVDEYIAKYNLLETNPPGSEKR